MRFPFLGSCNIVVILIKSGALQHDYVWISVGPAASSRLRLFEVTPCHVMFCCMRNVSCAMIWLVRLCMLPPPTLDDAGDASFLGPSRAPTQKVHMGSHARARQRPQIEQPKQNSTQARPENQPEKSKDRAAHEPATTKQKRTEQQPNAHTAFFDGM